jgi:methylisocitrate lyase
VNMTPTNGPTKRLEKKAVAAGVYDALSGVLAERAGFSALFVSGYAVEATQLAAPDLGLVTLTEMAQQAGRIASATSVPVICDIDTGYGGVNNIWRTVRELERAGVTAVLLEDQVNPKKCPFLAGRQVVSRQEAVGRVEAALDARSDDDFFIIGRSDADALSFDEVIERTNLYLQAGADIGAPVLNEIDREPIQHLSPDEQMRWHQRAADLIDGPVVCFGPPAGHTAEDMFEVGFDYVFFPVVGLQAAANSLAHVFATVHKEGTAEPYFTSNPPTITADRQLAEILSLDEYMNRESRFYPDSVRAL